VSVVKKALAAEEHALQSTRALDVVADAFGEGDEAAVSTRSVSPRISRFTMVPPAWTNASPSPWSRCRMKPSPPKSPAPNFF